MKPTCGDDIYFGTHYRESSSIDNVGPMDCSVEDAAIILDVIEENRGSLDVRNDLLGSLKNTWYPP